MQKVFIEEMNCFKEKDVYTKVPSQVAYDLTGKPPVDVRWVDVNKGMMRVPTAGAGLWRRISEGNEGTPSLLQRRHWKLVDRR